MKPLLRLPISDLESQSIWIPSYISPACSQPLTYPPSSGWKTGWCIVDTARRLATQIRSIKSSLQRCQLELIAFQWLHEDSKSTVGTGTGSTTSPRSAFISDLSAKLDVLRELESTIDEKQESYEAVENKIRQRFDEIDQNS